MYIVARHHLPAYVDGKRRLRLRAINASVDSARLASQTCYTHYEPASKYCRAPRPGWTWTPPVRQRFLPFSTFGEKLMLTVCGSLMLVLFLIMAR